MRWGLDSAYPPSWSRAQAWFNDGWSFFGGYIGGDALNVWTNADWARVTAAGFQPLPIWVGPTALGPGRDMGVADGNAALTRLQELNLSTVALDLENSLAPIEYARGFADAINAGSARAILYGAPRTLLELVGQGFAHWWLASWPTKGQRVTAAPPDWSLWQYATGPEADFNCCVDDVIF